MRDAIGLVVGWFEINFATEGRKSNNYCLELMRIDSIVYIILVQLWAAGEKAQPSSGHIREKRPVISFRAHEDLSCITSGRMSGMVWGKNRFHHHVLSDDLDDIQNPKYHMRRRTFF